MSVPAKQQIFISYSRVNKDFAIKLAKELRKADFSIWLDVLDIPAGARWDDEVEKALAECEIFMVILTPTSVASENVKDEIGYAIDSGKRIVPVLLENSAIPLRLRRFQYVDFTTKSYDDGIQSVRVLLANLDVDRDVIDDVSTPVGQTAKEKAREIDYLKPTTRTSSGSLSKGTVIIIGGVVGALLLTFGIASSLKNKTSSISQPTITSQPKEVQPSATSTSLPTLTAQVVATSTDAPVETSIPPTPTLGIASTMLGNDGMKLLYVPAGEYRMGSDVGESNEKPIHTVYQDAFWIDETEVTNSLFAAFLNEQGNQSDGGIDWYDENDFDGRISLVDDSWVVKPGYEDHPVVEVSWNGANAYCAWLDRNLPTESQWEKAARGDDEREYPWGNDTPGSIFLNFNNSVMDTTPVGKYPRGASPYGALDMGGNVSEWVADWYAASYYKNSVSDNPMGPSSGQSRVRRGGSFADHNYFVRTTFRFASDPDFTDARVGFRCAMDATP